MLSQAPALRFHIDRYLTLLLALLPEKRSLLLLDAQCCLCCRAEHVVASRRTTTATSTFCDAIAVVSPHPDDLNLVARYDINLDANN